MFIWGITCSYTHCYLGFVFFLQMCATDASYLAGEESLNISLRDINLTNEEEFLWIFNTTIGHRIRVSFLEFDFEFGYVFMDIGDGANVDGESISFDSNLSYTRLASFGASDLPSPVTSVGNTAWIRLRGTHRQDWKRHFYMTVTSTNVTDIKEVKTDKKTSIHSMNYPSNYLNNFYYLWDIRAPQGFIISVIVRAFDVENGADHLYIGDGVNRFTNQDGLWRDWSGRWSSGAVLTLRDFTSITPSITMIFNTDHSNSRSGFWIQLQAVEDPAQTNTERTISSNASFIKAITPTRPQLAQSTTTATMNPYYQSTPKTFPSTPHAAGDTPSSFSAERTKILTFSSSVAILFILLLFFAYRWYHLHRKNRFLRRSQPNIVYSSQDYFTLDPDIVEEGTSRLREPLQQSISDNTDGLGNHIYNFIGDLPARDNDYSRGLSSFARSRRDISLPPLPLDCDGVTLPNGCSGATSLTTCDMKEECCVVRNTTDNCATKDKLEELKEKKYKKEDNKNFACKDLYMEVRTDNFQNVGGEFHNEQHSGCLESSHSNTKTETLKTEDEKNSGKKGAAFDENEDCGGVMIDNILYEPYLSDKQS